MKYMILTYASQQDYDGMAGQGTDRPAWSPEEFAAMGAFMEASQAPLWPQRSSGAACDILTIST